MAASCHLKKQGQTVHKLQIATFWDIYSISPPIYIFFIYKNQIIFYELCIFIYLYIPLTRRYVYIYIYISPYFDTQHLICKYFHFVRWGGGGRGVPGGKTNFFYHRGIHKKNWVRSQIIRYGLPEDFLSK